MAIHLPGMHKNQKGFTLIEVVVALAITSVLSVGVAAVSVQVLNVNALSTNHGTVVKQVESALRWLSRDTRMAQVVQPGEDAGFPLSLSWDDWENVNHQVSYYFQDGTIYRSHSIDGGVPAVTFIAQYIDTAPEMTNCQYDSGVVAFVVTASTSGYKPVSESRSVSVIPRSAP